MNQTDPGQSPRPDGRPDGPPGAQHDPAPGRATGSTGGAGADGGGDAGFDRGFDAARLRTVSDMRRSRDDRMIAGVCAGAGRYLGIDPVIVRVVVAVMTFVGLSGLILYLAAWFLVPSEDAGRSVAADWFDLGADTERQVRTTGLLAAAVLALLAIVGDSGWSWGWGAWPLLWVLVWVGGPIAFLYWLLAVRPRRRGGAPTAGPPPPAPGPPPPPAAGPEPTGWPAAPAAADPVTSYAAPAPAAWTAEAAPTPAGPAGPGPAAGPQVATPPVPPRPRRPFSWALTLLTLSLVSITLAALYLWSGQDQPIRWTVYVAVALALVAAALLLGTVVGNAGPLIPVGLVLAALLVTGALLPTLRTGDLRAAPTSAAQLEEEYSLGMGRLELDLSRLDGEDLAGRTVRVDSGLGETIVLVPAGVEVVTDARVLAGQVDLFGDLTAGTRLDVSERDGPRTAGSRAGVLTLELDHSLGQVRVIRP